MYKSKHLSIKLIRGKKLFELVIQYAIAVFSIFNGTTVWKYVSDGLVVTGKVGYSFLGNVVSILCLLYGGYYFIILKKQIKKRAFNSIILLIIYNLVYIALSRFGIAAFFLNF